MSLKEALEVLKAYQEWRLGGEGEMIPPALITEAINVAIDCMERPNTIVYNIVDKWYQYM
jgi:hypothetical protein